MALPFANPPPPSKTRRTFPGDFTPNIDPELCIRAWAYWERNNREPIAPDHFQKVMLSNKNQEAHIFWIDDVIKWIRGLNSH